MALANIVGGFFRQISNNDRSRSIETNDCCVRQSLENAQGTFVYPNNSPPINITTGLTAYVDGASVQVVPDNNINTKWRIVGVYISNTSQKGADYIITFFQNGTNTEVMQVAARQENVISSSTPPIGQSKIIPGNIGVYAKARIGVSGARNIDIRIEWKLTGQA